MRTTGRSGLKRYGFARIGAIDRPLPAVTPSGSRGAVGQGGVFDSHVVPHPRVNPGHCSGLLHLHPMVTPHMPPAPDLHNGLCITIPPATGGTGLREASRSVPRSERRSPHGARRPQGRRRSPRRSVRPIPVRTAHKALNNATPERTQRRNQALVCGCVLRKYHPCVRNWGRGASCAGQRLPGVVGPVRNQGAGGVLRRRSADVRDGELGRRGATGVGGPRPGLRVCGVERGGEGVLRRRTGGLADRRTGGPENWRTGGPADRGVRARALQRNAPELPWRPSSARRR